MWCSSQKKLLSWKRKVEDIYLSKNTTHYGEVRRWKNMKGCQCVVVKKYGCCRLLSKNAISLMQLTGNSKITNELLLKKIHINSKMEEQFVYA